MRPDMLCASMGWLAENSALHFDLAHGSSGKQRQERIRVTSDTLEKGL